MYGINNNTGMTYQNSNSIAKLNRQNTDANGRGSKIIKRAISVLEGLEDITGALNGLKSNSGSQRLGTMASIFTKMFGK